MNTIAVVDDEESIRRSIQMTLGRTGIYTVRCHGSGEEALAQIPSYQPSLVLMDILMPGLSGIECTRLIKQLVPDVKVVMCTGFGDVDNIQQSLVAGACACLLKPFTRQQLLAVVGESLRGLSSCARELAKVFHKPRLCPEANLQPDLLTFREKEIMFFLHKKLSDKEIARRLEIDEETVHSHLQRIFHKFGVHSRWEAIARHFDEGHKAG